MVVEGNEWSVIRGGIFGPSFQTQLFRIQEEEIIDDVVYHSVYSTRDTTGLNWLDTGDRLREDSTGKVFIRNGDQDELLYDFSLELNDTIVLNYSNFDCKLFVYSIDTVVLFNGEERKQINFNTDFYVGYTGIFWIEGIGSSFGPFFRRYCTTDVDTNLSCFSNSDGELYSRFDCFIETSVSNVLPSDVKVFPKPFKNELHVNSRETIIQSYRIFDLHGKLVKEGDNVNDAIDMSSLQTGAFILLLEAADGNVYSDKLVKLD